MWRCWEISRDSWPRVALERLAELRKWREYSMIVAKAAKLVLGDKTSNIYVVGGVAEGRVTVYSDIDIVIVVRDPTIKNLDTIINIKLKAEDLGLPIGIPVDVKIATEEEFKENLGKLYKNVIEIPIE